MGKVTLQGVLGSGLSDFVRLSLLEDESWLQVYLRRCGTKSNSEVVKSYDEHISKTMYLSTVK
jgi:hypothetical protein